MKIRALSLQLLGALVLFLLAPALSNALDVPPLRGRVNDYAKLLSQERALALEAQLEKFEQETGHQIAVLTIPSLEGDSLEDFSIRVAETWKIGKKGFDNGAILLVARDDRKLRIEVGYGLEGVLPDAIASRIIREVITPRFRSGDYAGGIDGGVNAILKVARGETLPERAPSGARRNRFTRRVNDDDPYHHRHAGSVHRHDAAASTRWRFGGSGFRSGHHTVRFRGPWVCLVSRSHHWSPARSRRRRSGYRNRWKSMGG